MASSKKYNVIVEGNIACGKSTFLEYIRPIFSKKARIVSEPISQWTDLNGCNLLKELYRHPTKFSFQFQTFVQLTMARLQLTEFDEPFRFSERSLFSERFVFIEALKILQHISPTEYDILLEWFSFLSERSPPVDEIIYLRSSPNVAFDRLVERNRREEQPVTKDYVNLIHTLHEHWLNQTCGIRVNSAKQVPIRIVDQNKGLNQLKVEYYMIANEIMSENIM